MKALAKWFLALITIALCIAGAWLTIFDGRVWALGGALTLHAASVFASFFAARLRRGGRLTDPEADCVVYASMMIPFVGPATAFLLPRPEKEATVENAQQAMERYSSHVKPTIPDYERSLFTGDFHRDLARKVDLESYREVLRYGKTDQKRSALFRLAELGQPHHLALIRSCLEDDDQEVRLYAYGELERIVRGHEDAIAKGRRLVKADPADPAAHMNLAAAHFRLAESGVLDRATSGFHMRGAAKCAAKAREFEPDDIAAAILQARAYANYGDFEQAESHLDNLPLELRSRPEIGLVRAELAFAARDFARARVEAGHLLLEEVELPGWLEALLMTVEERPAPAPAAPRGREENP